MKLPSLQQITEDAVRALRRFPFVLATAVAGSIAAVVLIGSQDGTQPAFAFRLFFAALVGVPFLIGLALAAERWHVTGAVSFGLQAGGVVLLALYAWSLPPFIPAAPEYHIIRLLLLAAGMHLFVAVAPWLRRGEVNGFWYYNKALLLRLLTAALFAHVLFAGLALALAAVENLFELQVPGERYGQLWALLTGVFMTWFFLAGIPKDLDALDAQDDYPRVLKIFSQNVLLPLVVIYLAILTAYSVKIVVAWSWPYGWVSRLILGYAAAGMFAMLLLHPLRERGEHRWLGLAARWFYVTLIPLLVMYFLAVARRLSDYGYTESRYLGIVLGVWIGAMALYFLLSRAKSIKIIPSSLCVIAFLVSVGPWSAFSVSEQSQVSRLRSLLESNGMFEDGKVRKAHGAVPFEDRSEMSAVLQYLHGMHGYGAIQPWFETSLRNDSPEAPSEWKAPNDVAALAGIEYLPVRRSGPDSRVGYDASLTEAVNVAGFDRMLPLITAREKGEETVLQAGGVTCTVSRGNDTLTVMRKSDAEPAEYVALHLAPLAESLLAKYHGVGVSDVPPDSMMIETTAGRLRVKAYVLNLQLTKVDAQPRIDWVRLRVLIGEAPDE